MTIVKETKINQKGKSRPYERIHINPRSVLCLFLVDNQLLTLWELPVSDVNFICSFFWEVYQCYPIKK